MQPVRLDEMAPDAVPVPMGIVQYVLRTRAHVLLEDAAQTGMFTFDPYVMHYGTKSALCLPVLGQNKVMGALYLDNNLMTGTSLSTIPIFLLLCPVFISLNLSPFQGLSTRRD